MKWTQVISADVSFQILGILLYTSTSGAFPFRFDFREKAVKMFARNVGDKRLLQNSYPGDV